MILKIDRKALTAITLRAFLRQQGFSQALWRKLKHNGVVTVNGIPVNLSRTILSPTDEIMIFLNEKSNIIPQNIPLDICYEDEYFLAVNKPANLLVHPVGAEKYNTLGNAILYYYQQKNELSAFHPMHRLDRNTTGLVLIAKHPNIQHIMTTGAKKMFSRKYIAIISGKIAPENGTIDLPVSRQDGSIIKHQVSENGKSALTNYNTLSSTANGEYSLLQLSLETGRTHQIRVHLSYLGHPLLGDDLYGGNHNLINRQALHAYKICFYHPVSEKEITITAPVPKDFLRLLSDLNLKPKNESIFF